MANERLRDAMLEAGLSTSELAQKMGVDPKTVQRWVSGRQTPYQVSRHELATLVKASQSYLWPDAMPPERQTTVAAAEIVSVYPHRNSIPSEIWDQLLDDAADRIDVLVHAGQFLAERPNFVRTLADKAAAGVNVRINFGDPDGTSVALRNDEEHLEEGVLAARIKYGLTAYRPLLGVPGIEFRFHPTTLYNSIFRFDGEMIVNMHVYGVPGAHAPALHLRKLGAGDLFDTYAGSFVDVWKLSEPATW